MRLCSELANYGVDKVLNFKRAIKTFLQSYADVISRKKEVKLVVSTTDR
jgi:hypothetical protein